MASDSKFATQQRINEAIRLLACLERLTLHTSSVLGTMLMQAEGITSSSHLRSALTGTLRPLGVDPDAVMPLMQGYVDLAKEFDGVVGAPMSVGDALEFGEDE